MVSHENPDNLADALADMLFGDRRAAAQRYNGLFAEEIFDQDWWTATQDPGARAYDRYLRLLPRLSVTNTVADLRELVTLHEQATVVDPHLGSLLTVQVNLVLGTLLEQHAPTGEVAAALADLVEGRAVGAYVLTEVGHGSDLNNLETTAFYDPAEGGGFVLCTPTDTAIKFMPTTAAPPVDGIARFGIVFARLVIDGTGHGVYPFLVRLCDADGQVRPGITIRRLPDKPGLGMDNSLTRFDGVRVPRECLLSHTGTRIDQDGRLISPIPADNQVWRAISRVRVGRLCISAMAAAVSRAAVTTAVRHSAQRDIASMAGGRVPLAHVPAHHAPLLDAISETYIATTAVELAVDAFAEAIADGSDEQGPHLTDLVALTKYLATSTALRVCGEVRDRLGAQGMFSHNKIVEYRALRDAAATAEGDSYVIALLAAYRRLSLPDEWRPGYWDNLEPLGIDTPDTWLEWLGARAAYLQHTTLAAYAETVGDRQARWNSVYDLALAAAHAHLVHQAAQSMAVRASELPAGPRQVAQNLLTLFAIHQCQSYGADMLPDGPFPKTRESLRDMRHRLYGLLAPHLGELVGAFELESGSLRTVFDSDTYITQCANALAHGAG
ncbi:acyl-CoA dehydrogenase family protein [Nocardia acidivorans]|uniref:acyl-CoA dehydrogenase family protein n=1 Tax=Nocardia acidivorans TaxID=404580 RepID=UPI00082E847F|nr:acyl-CoA dehydrogenase family protein [Nocardia acidivorans]